MGLRGPEHIYLMDQTLNETEHLEYMESRDGNRYWIKSRTHLLLGQRGLLLGDHYDDSCCRNLWKVSCFEWS